MAKCPRHIRRRSAAIALALLAASACQQSPTARQALTIYEPEQLTAACNKALREARQDVEALASAAPDPARPQAFLEAWDLNGAKLSNILGPIYLQAYVHPKQPLREAGENCILEANRFQTELFQNEVLYKKTLALTPQVLDNASQKLQQDLLQAFTTSGVALEPVKRQRAADITETIERLAQAFQTQLRENQGAIRFQEADVEGLSESWKQQARQADGSYLVNYDYPQYFPFMRNASNADARKRYYQGFTNRGGPDNLDRLDEIVALRQALADLHVLPSYAHLASRNRMLNSPAAINEFLAQVKQPVLALETRDIAYLSKLKQQHTGDNSRLQRWDLAFYLEQARQQKFSINQEALRQYFPTKATVRWALAINEKLLGIDIRPAKAPQWHPDVQYYDVFDSRSQEYLGAIYLDLYPRDGKYKHAAAFPVRSGSRLLKQRPTSALVTNFDRQGLTQNEVETLLHELGHVFHGVLSKTWYASHSGTEVQRDFVEAPSQMLEAWARRYETLSKVANYCDGCPAISEDMVSRLEAARRFGQGTQYARQHLYASFDMELATMAPMSAQQTWEKLESQSALGHLKNTSFPGTFGHITGGYAAGYYGYMWSEVLALDMQSVFGDNLMNPELGLHYRRSILEAGGERPPQQLVHQFLGREPSPSAFFEQFSANQN
jgi:thimet oligopeptidase